MGRSLLLFRSSRLRWSDFIFLSILPSRFLPTALLALLSLDTHHAPFGLSASPISLPLVEMAETALDGGTVVAPRPRRPFVRYTTSLHAYFFHFNCCDFLYYPLTSTAKY
jgi:hypothetical protein